MSLSAIVYVLAFFAGCFYAFRRHPIYGLMTYVGTFYLNPAELWWGQALPDLRWSLSSAAITALALFVARKKQPGMPLFTGKLLGFLLAFVVWLAIQSGWAMIPEMHTELLTMYIKYAVLVILIFKCVDSAENMRLFLWAHVVGCAYLGWVAYTSYSGGRFEGFGGGGIGEANAGALQVVTGLISAAGLFLSGKFRDRVMLLPLIPFIANALVTTISRSGFVALAAAGLVFNLFTPKRFRGRVRLLSVLAVVLFMLLTNPIYWMRIASIGYMGEDIRGVDTGGGRLEIMQAQWRMFSDHPLGCGHRCTVSLSPHYLEARFLTGTEEEKGRASHNTMLTLLVEQGFPGILFYVAYTIGALRATWILARRFKGQETQLAALFPALAGVLAAVTIGDVFVDFLKAEVRIWFIALLAVMLYLSDPARVKQEAPAPGAGPRKVPGALQRPKTVPAAARSDRP
jgi:hypothetical protein